MTTTPTPLEYASPSVSSRRPSVRAIWDTMGMLLVFILLFMYCSIRVDNFFSWINIRGLLLSVTTVGMLSCTMLFCLAAGDFDLSIGSVVAMSGVLAAVVMAKTGSVALGIGAGILSGGLVGVVNGVVIAQLGINALIATLATMQIVRGAAYLISEGKAVGISKASFYSLGISSFPAGFKYSLTTPVWIMIACFIIFGILLNRTIFGRNTLAVGGNAEAARLAGIRTRWLKIVIFTLQGLMGGLAGVVLAARMTSGQPMAGMGLELQVIAACVLGGVALTGGTGTMVGVVVGVLIMGTVQNAMNLMNINPFYQYVAFGSILLAAVLLDRLRTRGGRA